MTGSLTSSWKFVDDADNDSRASWNVRLSVLALESSSRSSEADALNGPLPQAESVVDLGSDSKLAEDTNSGLFPLTGSALWDSRSVCEEPRLSDWAQVEAEPRLDEDAADCPDDESPRECE